MVGKVLSDARSNVNCIRFGSDYSIAMSLYMNVSRTHWSDHWRNLCLHRHKTPCTDYQTCCVRRLQRDWRRHLFDATPKISSSALTPERWCYRVWTSWLMLLLLPWGLRWPQITVTEIISKYWIVFPVPLKKEEACNAFFFLQHIYIIDAKKTTRACPQYKFFCAHYFMQPPIWKNCW